MKTRYVLLALALGAVLLVVSAMQSPFAFLGKYAALANLWPSVKSMVYHAEADHLQAKLATATADVTVARHEAEQLTASAAITHTTVVAQDTHINAQRADTARDIEVIHERIATTPAACVPVDDAVVRQRAIEAVRRAQAAQDRLQRAPPDRSGADATSDIDRLEGLGIGIHPGNGLGEAGYDIAADTADCLDHYRARGDIR